MKQLIYNYYIEEMNSYKLKENDIFISDDLYIIKSNFTKKLTKNDLKKLDKIFFLIDFSNVDLNIKVAKKIIKKVKNISKFLKKNNNKIGVKNKDNIIIGNIIGIEQQYANDILVSITIPLINNKYDKYNFLYDSVCWYLDNEFRTKNLCGFKNDRCIGVSNDSSNCAGCCHHFPNKKFGAIYQSSKALVLCENFNTTGPNKGCSTKCIMCKLITCTAVRKKGVSFNVWNVLLLRYYFNWWQKWIIISHAFTKKEIILNKIIARGL